MKTNVLIAVGAVVAVAVGGALFNGLGSADEPAPVSADIGSGTLATIYRDPGCSCCDSYAEYLEAHGFRVELVDDPNFDERSIDAGVPEQGLGCHLATIEGYAVSGLVPASGGSSTSAPRSRGITLPGMPANAPGMAPEKTGTLRIYGFGPDGVSVFSDE